MNIIEDFKLLLNDLKEKFNSEKPIIHDEKNLHDMPEYVLEADIFSQNHLIEISKKYHPNYEIISEELNNYHNIAENQSDIVIMDPLDGTHNYLYGLPMWGVSYTVFSKDRGAMESYIGLPMIDILLEYSEGEIFVHSLNSESNTRSIKLNPTEQSLSKQMIAFDNQFYKDPINTKKNYDILVDNAFTTRISGSSVFDIAMLIIGRLNARLWHNTEVYDVAPIFAFLKGKKFAINLYTGHRASLKDSSIIATTDISLYKQLEEIGLTEKL